MPENENTLSISGSNVKCKNCGGNLTFDPVSQDLHCLNCDSHFVFDKNQTQIKHQLIDGKSQDDTAKHNKWASELKIVKCQTCGAEIMLTGLEVSKTCPYCGSDYVSETNALPGLKPDVVIPFAFNEERAAELFVVGMKKKFFAPRALKKKLPNNKIRGIYIPSFTFDADTFTKYDGTLYKNETYHDAKGNSRTRKKYFKISGTQSCNHRDYVEETSTQVNEKQVNAILPYDFSKSYEYDLNFIRGYSLEHYENRLDSCYQNAKGKMEAEIRRIILSRYDYSGVDKLNMYHTYSNEQYSYRILPVYFFEFLWKKKNYMVLMNGQTGKVGRQYPKSILKISLVILLAIIVVASLVLLVLLPK